MKRAIAVMVFLMVNAALLRAQTLGGAIVHPRYGQVWGTAKITKNWTLNPQYLRMSPEKETGEEHHDKTPDATNLGILTIGRSFRWGHDQNSSFTPAIGPVTNGSKMGVALQERFTWEIGEKWELESHVTLVRLPGQKQLFVASEPLLEVSRKVGKHFRVIPAGLDVDHAFGKTFVEGGAGASFAVKGFLVGGMPLIGAEGLGWKLFVAIRPHH